MLSGQVKADSRRTWDFASRKLEGNLADNIYLKKNFLKAKSKPRSMVWISNNRRC